MPVYLLDDTPGFPPPHLAMENGLLAMGGDLSNERLLLAYQMGIFPWYSEGEPILWWSPDPRLVLYPEEIHISKSLQKILKKGVFQVTLDLVFEQIIHACATIRRNKEEGTWITQEMMDAYIRLHNIGAAHSVETWFEGTLAGGFYGVALGRCFFGESMFARISNASKVALAKLADHLRSLSFHMIDCQMTTPYLKQFGAREIPRRQFIKELRLCLTQPREKTFNRSLITTPTPFYRDHHFN